MKRRILSVFLSVVLAFSLLGAVPAAAGVTEGDVCRIETTGYTTLGAALTAVTEGKTIVLLTDIAYDSPIITNTRSFSIDLAGYDLSVASGQVYCLAATGGKQLAVANSSETESSLTIMQTIPDADLATASNFGAVYTSGAASRIVIAANVDAAVTTNMIGVDASDGNSIQIGRGTVRADRIGVNVTGTGSVLFTGDVYGLGSGADGVSCRSSGDVHVNGTVYSDGIGVDAQSSGHVAVTNGVVVYNAHGSNGVYATGNAIVQITGEVSAPTRGVFAEGGSISVDGSVTGTGIDSIGAFSRDTISPAGQGTVTITGSVSGARFGAEAAEGGTILVGGDARSTAGSASYVSSAVYSRGVGSMIIVTGNAVADGQNSSGVEVYAGGTAEVNGNVTAAGASSYGVRALSGTYYGTLYGSTATIDGTITATKYILIGATEKTKDAWDEVTINGYLSFSGASPLCYVFVKAPVLQADPPTASPAGGAVSSGTKVVLTTATAGAEIHYTLDGSVPSASSALYTEPIPVTAAVIIKAVAMLAGWSDSAVMTAAFTIAAPPATDAPAEPTYEVAVTGSYAQTTGAGAYSAGAAVGIHAGTRSGFTFAGWTSPDVTITNAAGPDASFTMPDHAVTVAAAWNPAAQESVVYSFTQGANGRWSGLQGQGLTFVCNGPFERFSGVQVDGAALSAGCCAAGQEGTVVTLKPEYLRTLANGDHILRLVYTNGSAQTGFTVASVPASRGPRTGDKSSAGLWAALLGGVGVAAAVFVCAGKRRKEQ